MKLATWIETRRMSQDEFALQIGCDRSSVSRYIAGERVPRREIIARIVAVTGGEVTANDFYQEPVDGAVDGAGSNGRAA